MLAFAVTLSRAPSGTVTVDYATADGTATAGSDYTARSGTLTFAAGETGKTVSVPVLDDAHDEGSETLTLTLSSPSGGVYRGRRGDGDDQQLRPDAEGVAWAVRAHGGGPGTGCGGRADDGFAGCGDGAQRGGAPHQRCRGERCAREARIRGVARSVDGLAAGRGGGCGRRAGEGPRLPDRLVVRADARHGRGRLRCAMGPGRGLALRRSRGRSHARRRGWERAVRRGLDAGRRDGGVCARAFARRGRVPEPGRGRRGREHAHRRLPLGAVTR